VARSSRPFNTRLQPVLTPSRALGCIPFRSAALSPPPLPPVFEPRIARTSASHLTRAALARARGCPPDPACGSPLRPTPRGPAPFSGSLGAARLDEGRGLPEPRERPPRPLQIERNLGPFSHLRKKSPRSGGRPRGRNMLSAKSFNSLDGRQHSYEAVEKSSEMA